jgi:hypothetical protein
LNLLKSKPSPAAELFDLSAAAIKPMTISPAMGAVASTVAMAPAMHAVAPAVAAHAPGSTLGMHGKAGGTVIHQNINMGGVRVSVSGTAKPADVKAAVLDAMKEHTHELATELKRHQLNLDRGSF